MNPAVLVTDGEQRAALAAVRSLGRAGLDVHVCSSRVRSLAGASRFAVSRAVVPDSLALPERYAEAVGALVQRLGVQVVLPMTDASILALLAGRSALGSAVLPIPNEPTWRLVADKAAMLDMAAELGLAVPVQTSLVTPGDAAQGLENLRFPVVLKPSRSVADTADGRTKFGVHHARDEAALAGLLAGLPGAAFPVLLQERIVGPGLGYFFLFWNGRVLARFAHRRIREKPPSGGVSVRAVSVPSDPELSAQAESLLRQVGWNGVAMVEFKGGADGSAYLMEINGRFWGSLQLAIDAGVDFPRLLVAAALGTPLPPALEYRAGVQTRWWWGEVDHLLSRLRNRSEALALLPGAPSPASIAIDILTAPLRGVRGEVCRLSDPAPAFRESLDWIRGR